MTQAERKNNSTEVSHDIEYRNTADRVSTTCLIVNLLLSSAKLAAGFFGHSSAMVSDAAHSFSDAVGDLIAIIGVHLGERKADKEHPYGHERLESVASIGIGVLLLLTGLGVGMDALMKILTGAYKTAASPGSVALIAALFSIVMKELMYRFTIHYADRLGSNALRAEAWHNRADAFSSVGALVGIFFARMGYPVLDPLAGFLISLFILHAAYEVFRDSFRKMVDHSCDAAFEEALRACAMQHAAVRGIDLLRTREFGRYAYVDIEIRLDKTLSLEEAHTISHEVHDALEASFPVIKHVMIHVNPC